VALHCVGRDETARHSGGGASNRGWGSVRNGGDPTRFYTGVDAGNVAAWGKKMECGRVMNAH
jgi:hypothetical protein